MGDDMKRQTEDGMIKYVTDTADYKHIKHRTQDFKVSAVVDDLSDDAVFEVELDTFLDQPAEVPSYSTGAIAKLSFGLVTNSCVKMRYGDIYKIVHYKSRRFVAAGDGAPTNNSTVYLYPEEENFATPFLLKRAGAIDSTDIIKANDTVELRVLDKRNNFKGFAAFAYHETVCARPWSDRWKNPDILFFRFERVKYDDLVK